MQLRKMLLIGVLGTMTFQSQAQRLVGYLPSYTASFTDVQFGKMTDVIFCFINPDASGTGALVVDRVGNANFDFEMEKFQIVKSKCYPMVDNGPKLWIALGGADPGNARAGRIAGLCASAAGRTNLSNALVAFAIKHDLEGIDLDWEFPSPGTQATNFGLFVVELRARINASSNTNLKISVAVGGETIGGCAAGHLSYFDFSVAGSVAATDYFNIMTYDLPAGYNNNHSTLANGNTSLNDWSSCKSIPKSKMLMGVPFYGRNAARTLIQNYKSMGAGANASDLTGGYYYNGDATIAAKIDAVRATHNANGIMIWDVDMDKNHASGQSLLSAAYVKMFGNAASNPCSTRPYMGKDTTMCSGQNLTLNPQVNATGAAGTRTFAWTRNGASTGGNTNTLTITQGGTYKVTITQGPTNCVLTDEIIVSEQADVTAPTTTPVNYVCSSGSNPSTSIGSTSTGTVEWYTASTGGARFATGTSTSVSPTSTTTYYVQSSQVPTNKKYYAGRGAIMSNALWMERNRNNTQTNRPEWVQQFTVQQPLVLRSVVVYFKSNATNNPIQIYVMDASTPGSTTMATVPTQVSANTTAAISVPARSGTEPWGVYPVIVPVNITFQPGIYYVGVYNPNGDAASQGAGLETSISQLSSFAGVYSIGATAHQNYGGGYGVAGAHYGQLFDWRIESAALSQCVRKSVTVLHDCTLPVQLVSFTAVHQNGGNLLTWKTASEKDNNYFEVERSDNGVDFYAIGQVKGRGDSRETGAYSFVDSNPIEGANYYRLVQYDYNGEYAYSSVVLVNLGRVSLYEVLPNPSTDEFNVKFTNSSNRKSIYLVNIQGEVVYTSIVEAGETSVKIGKELLSGIYILKIQDGEALFVSKIIKK